MSDAAEHPALTLLLASRSPRRALLLREAGFDFRQITPPFDDPADPNTPPEVSASETSVADDPRSRAIATAQRLAQHKARSIRPEDLVGVEGAVVVTADTLGVTASGRLIGTPETRDHAHAMLAELLNHTHTLVTGVALRPPGNSPANSPDDHIHTFADTATVNLGHVNDDQLRAYVDSGQWVGKAGGYNLIERQHAGWPITVTGDPATVMGLPMRKLVPRLVEWGIVPAGAGR